MPELFHVNASSGPEVQPDSSACRRENMLEFFATSGDFTRRLTSVKANRKFSSPLSGPEDYYSVSTHS